MIQPPLPTIDAVDCTLRFLEPHEASKMVAFRLENREHLRPWEPVRRPEFFTEAYWTLQLKTSIREFQRGLSVSLVILTPQQDEVIGVCNFSNIVRGTFQSCHLGYSIAEKYEGKGYMKRALKPACDYMFRTLGLHRIMANYLPHNERSGKLLSSLGFEKEGFARSFLMINGRWEDHVLTSLINPDNAV